MSTGPHPHRYPQHDSDKGAVFGGICNRTACDRRGATYFNAGTFGYYCADCANGVNFNPRRPPLCVQVTAPLTHAEMDARYRAYPWN